MKNFVFIIFMTFLAYPAGAMEGNWKGELTPYLWIAGMDGEATVAGQKADVNVDFDDTHPGGSLLGVLQYGQVVCWGQVDRLSLEADLDLDHATLKMDLTVATLAVGYQFQGSKGKTYDLLLGAREVWLDRELKMNGTLTRNRELTDMVVVFRPSIPLSQNWRFNPTASCGGGDSRLTYELWPQVQYQISEHWAARIGYRRLYYDIRDDGANKWNGGFQGPVIGVGGTW